MNDVYLHLPYNWLDNVKPNLVGHLETIILLTNKQTNIYAINHEKRKQQRIRISLSYMLLLKAELLKEPLISLVLLLILLAAFSRGS